jgi:Zn-dependent peptidase ImmA (M78 family)
MLLDYKLGPMTLAEIHDLAEKYSERYNPDKVAPFPWENIVADKDDLRIYYANDMDEQISGATLLQDDKYYILINQDKHENRQHFTLGHELGHYFLHKDALRTETALIDTDPYLDVDKILYRLDEGGRNRIEREANHFAACLLMPSELVRKAWKVNANIEDLAEIFKVSTIAMSIRLTELDLVS